MVAGHPQELKYSGNPGETDMEQGPNRRLPSAHITLLTIMVGSAHNVVRHLTRPEATIGGKDYVLFHWSRISLTFDKRLLGGYGFWMNSKPTSRISLSVTISLV